MNLPVARGANADLIVGPVGASMLDLDDVVFLAGEFATDEAGLAFPPRRKTLEVVFASDCVLAPVRSTRRTKLRPSGECGEPVIAALNGAPELAQESSQTGLPRGF
jgi:hypothetical protein